MNLIEINNLSISFPNRNSGELNKVVSDISFFIKESEMLALVGESGSGKSVTALSILSLLPDYSKIEGEILFNNSKINNISETEIIKIRGNEVSFIFQEPMTSLNPLHTIGKQISEILYLHGIKDKNEIENRIRQSLEEVGLSSLTNRLKSYPHELSGGQRQRVMIAMALINKPKLLIADEPTTALDVTVQKQILELLRKLQTEKKMSILLITHDLTVVNKYADRTIVMQNGRIVESNTTSEIINNPKQAYTKHLIASIPKGIRNDSINNDNIVIKTSDLSVNYITKKNFFGKPIVLLRALNKANIDIKEGETLAVVGESGSGKSTLAYAILKLIKSEGLVTILNNNISNLDESELRPYRKNIQIVFQDPFSSLNPRLTIERIISEGLNAHFPEMSEIEKINKVESALEEVGLEPEMMHRYPHEFSGGQRQRIGIARCLVLSPKLIILDEPSSALDVSTQSEILNLLVKLQLEKKIAYLFISHDLRVIKTIAHRIIVMKNGEIIEQGTTNSIFSNPANSYTKELIEAAMIA